MNGRVLPGPSAPPLPVPAAAADPVPTLAVDRYDAKPIQSPAPAPEKGWWARFSGPLAQFFIALSRVLQAIK